MAASELCLEIFIDSELSALEDSYVITMLLSTMHFELGVAHILQKQRKKKTDGRNRDTLEWQIGALSIWLITMQCIMWWLKMWKQKTDYLILNPSFSHCIASGKLFYFTSLYPAFNLYKILTVIEFLMVVHTKGISGCRVCWTLIGV